MNNYMLLLQLYFIIGNANYLSNILMIIIIIKKYYHKSLISELFCEFC